MYLKTQALVLRSVDYRESDSILTVLTGEHGLMTLKARGVRRQRSELKSACQLLTYSEFTIFEHRGFATVNEAVALEMFSGLRKDIVRLALASYFAQVAEVLSQQDKPDEQVLSLTLNSLYALSAGTYEPQLIKAAFELRMISHAGYEPMLSGCPVCGNRSPDRFNVSGGTAECARCGSDGLRLPLCGASLAAMRYILLCDRKRLFSFRLEPDAAKRLGDICQTYLLTQLERGFPTLDFYESLIL